MSHYSKDQGPEHLEVPLLIFPIDDNQVQIALMKRVEVASEENPYAAWFACGSDGKSFAERFRAYVESSEHQGEVVDISREDVLDGLFKAIQPPTVH